MSRVDKPRLAVVFLSLIPLSGCQDRLDVFGSLMSVGVAAAVVIALALAAVGFRTRHRLDAVPPELEESVTVGGMSHIRYWADRESSDFLQDALEAIARERGQVRPSMPGGPLSPAEFLAISGGGENGAFGAGLLAGWSASGTRPRFKAVTGISTGALIAPFAFLGPDYDEALKKLYTGISKHDVLKHRNVLAAVFDDAMADNGPLRKTVRRIVDQPLLDAIAAEHEKGRLLLRHYRS